MRRLRHVYVCRLPALVAATASLVAVLAACGSNDGGAPIQSHANAYSGFCPDVVLCIVGDHWDSSACRCVPDAADAGNAPNAATDAAPEAARAGDGGVCVDTVLCIVGTHWDSTACRCAPDEDAGTDDGGSPATSDDAGAGDDADDAAPCNH